MGSKIVYTLLKNSFIGGGMVNEINVWYYMIGNLSTCYLVGVSVDRTPLPLIRGNKLFFVLLFYQERWEGKR